MAETIVGPTVLKYQRRFAEEVGAEHAWAFELGRHAMAVALKALGIGKGHHVGICAFSCLSVYEAISVLDAQPVFLDIDHHLCIDPAALELAAPSLSAVVLQHTFGNPGQLEKLLQVCREHRLLVVEDCAHALGCAWQGRALGSFGESAVYSFEWGKPYSTGQGGMLTTNNDELAQKISEILVRFSHPYRPSRDLVLVFQRFLRETALPHWLYPAARRLARRFRGLRGGDFATNHLDIPKFSAYVHRSGPVVALAGLRQLRKLSSLKAIRKANDELIEREIRKTHLAAWPRDPRASVIALRYPVLVANKGSVLSKTEASHVALADWYRTPIHPIKSPLVLKRIGYSPDLCPNAERVFRELVHLPTKYRLSPHRLKRTLAILAEGGSSEA